MNHSAFCSFKHCDQVAIVSGYCQKHYQIQHRKDGIMGFTPIIEISNHNQYYRELYGTIRDIQGDEINAKPW